MKTNQGGKFIDVKRSFLKMLESYKQIRKLIHKLTNVKFHHINDIDDLITDAQTIRKIKEREIRYFAELQLIEQAENKLKIYLNKNDCKIRRYDVYSHVICFLDLIWDKINEFVPKNIDICRLTPQIMRWKMFLSELNESKEAMNGWLKQIPIENVNLKQKNYTSTLVYKINTNNVSKINTPSTAYMTNFETPQNESIEKQKHNQQSVKKQFSYLKRSQSACKEQISKMMRSNQDRKNYPLKVRSPQDKGIQFKENIGLEKSVFSRKFIRNSSKKRLFLKIEPENKFSGSIQIIQLKELKEANEITKELKKKSSIEFQQNKNILKPNEVSDAQSTSKQVPSSKYEAIIHSKKLERNQRRSSIRKIKQTLVQTQVNKSAFATKILEDLEKDEDSPDKSKLEETIEQQQIIAQLGQKFKSSKRGKNNKKLNFTFNPDNEPKNKEKIYNKTKRNSDMKILKDSQTETTKIPQIVSGQLPIKTIKDKKSTRRNGIINSKQMVTVLGKLQTKIRQDEKEREMQLKKKAIEMNERLINQLQLGQGVIFHEQNLANQVAKKKQFDNFYRQLTSLKVDQIKESKSNPWGAQSSFFIQQNFLREQKSRQLQEYIKKLRSSNRSIGEVFQIKSEDSNLKIQNYMIMERKLAFQSQNQWLKNYHNTHIETNDSIEFVQGDYPSSRIPQSIQRF